MTQAIKLVRSNRKTRLIGPVNKRLALPRPGRSGNRPEPKSRSALTTKVIINAITANPNIMTIGDTRFLP